MELEYIFKSSTLSQVNKSTGFSGIIECPT